MPILWYQCEYCGTGYTKKEAALECEDDCKEQKYWWNAHVEEQDPNVEEEE